MSVFFKKCGIVFAVSSLGLLGVIFTGTARAQDRQVDIPQIVQKNKVILQKKTGDEVGLNPQPVPPAEKGATVIQQKAGGAVGLNPQPVPPDEIQSKKMLKMHTIKRVEGSATAGPDTNIDVVQDSRLQNLSSTTRIKIGRGWFDLVVSDADFKKFCSSIKIIAKNSEGEVYKFTPEFHASHPAFGLPRTTWCETETITVPANQEMHFIASMIDDEYKVTPLQQKVSFKVNEPQNVNIEIVKKAK